MRKFRKVISVMLAACLMLGVFAGCGKEKKVSGRDDEGKSTEEKTTEETRQEQKKAESVVENYKDKAGDNYDSYLDTAVVYEEAVYESTECDAANSATVANDTGIADDSSYCYEYPYYPEDFDTREYTDYEENRFMSVAASPFSTFAADTDTASYSNIRSYIEMGDTDIPKGAVRIEEMVNYFNYDYKMTPEGDDKFAVYTEYKDCPWNDETKLMMFGINTENIDFEDKKPSNLVFLIDTSGSMLDDNKLPLAQKAFKMLAENLDGNDTVSIVTYAGDDTVVLSGAKGDDTYKITEALDSFVAEGSTNGSAGILTAYELAEKHYIAGGNNRVILATDGDLNVGLTSESDLVDLITEEKEKNHIFISVLGFGNDNLKDNKLEALADNGNGNYAYIDSVYEAKKVLVDDMGGTLYTVAKDVKFQVEFNPEKVKGYRLIGYENRILNTEDFNDDSVDGGEIGAGHMVTVLYEVVPVDSDYEIETVESRYGNPGADMDKKAENTSDEAADKVTNADFGDEIGILNIRYKEPDAESSVLQTKVIKEDKADEKMSDDMMFAASVALFGMALKDSGYIQLGAGDIKFLAINTATEMAQQSAGDDEYRKQFISMMEEYQQNLSEEDDTEYYIE